MFKFLFKQYELKYIGSFIHVMYQTMPLLSIVANIFSAATVFGVWRAGIISWFPWMSLGIFLAIVFCFAASLVFIVYKFIYPSYYNFQNHQQFKDNDPLKEMIKQSIREVLKENEHNN